MLSSLEPGNEIGIEDQVQPKPRVLVVDDDSSLREFLEIFLAKEGYKVASVPNGEEAVKKVKNGKFSLVITDVRMPGMDGVELLKGLKALDPGLPVILITAFASLDAAVVAMKEGAYDYLTKPFSIEELRDVIENAISSRQDNNFRPAETEDKIYRLDQMVARSQAMLKIFQMIPRVASSPSSVLITGESGTGKELVARAIHNLGDRKEYPFVVVNCGGIPETLLESELFGHKKGAFTGADRDKAGLFATANNGTIFLDEIGELPMVLQVKLLRVVQQRSFIPIGGTSPIKVDCRIIAATNRNLEKEVMEGNFREDLYYRLNVIQLRMPPLRERADDIPLLVQYFLDRYAKRQGKSVQGISSFAMQALLQYPFPGNVRELENIIERSVALSTTSLILPESLYIAKHKHGDGFSGHDNEGASLKHELPPEGLDLDEFLGKIEKDLLLQALEKSGGRKTEAAKLLGVNFRSFRYRLSKYEIN
ncbi:MAG: sigma-54-dependent Fis family transcriptional regulator [Thermodesulfatator sp.]|nr:MAG: sigma-54-dependent Fis family transcriptional regulator [Thermodesulfatator sp.]